MGKASQKKGRQGEKELSEILNSYGFNTRPGNALNFGKEPDVIGIDGIHCEVKRHERMDLYAWLRQSQEDSQKFKDGLPCVMHRSNRHGWIVSMPLESWIELYWIELYKEGNEK